MQEGRYFLNENRSDSDMITDDEYSGSDNDSDVDDFSPFSNSFSYFASSSASPSPPLPPVSTSLHLFRLSSLRLHDNPALCAALKNPCTQFKAIFILDPWFMSVSQRFGLNRWRFLIECLHDLKKQLNSLNLQLYVARGLTTAVLSRLCHEWDVVQLTYQISCEPGSATEERSIDELCSNLGVKVEKFLTHSLFDPSSIMDLNNGDPVLTFKKFSSLFPKLEHPLPPLPTPVPCHGYFEDDTPSHVVSEYQVPTLSEVGYGGEMLGTNPWVGGETEALKRLPIYCEVRKKKFADPVDMLLDKTSLSPYIRFGCLSVRHLCNFLCKLAMADKQYDALRIEVITKLLQREFYFIVASQVPNFECDRNNNICLPFPWENDVELLNKWKNGMTGYPWIDAALCQLHKEGWIHHQLRESIATFLTRGDLWLSWVHGKDMFEIFMLDFEPSVSCGCWMKSSGSSFLTGTFEHYCPISFGKKIDPTGRYIRKYLPKLANFPSEYIYSPWMAPPSLQKELNCIIGVDYPVPIIDHLTAGTICIERIKQTVAQLTHFVSVDQASPPLS